MEGAVRSEDAASSLARRWVLPLISLAACALFVAGALFFYFGPDFAATLNSDAAVPVLLADEVLRTARPVPSTWYFGNDEIWTLAPHLFAMPFVAAIGISTLALKLGNLLCLGVMVSFLALTLHRVVRNWPYAILVTAGVFAAFSVLQEFTVYSQSAYGWFTALFSILIYLALRIQDERKADSWRLDDVRLSLSIYVLVLAAMAAESPMRAAAYWVVPLVAVTLAFPISRKRSRALAAWTIVALLAGALLHGAIGRHVLSQAGLTAALIKPIAEWRLNVLRIWVGLPQITGWAQAPYASFVGVLDRVRLCLMMLTGLVVLIAPTGDGPGSTECRFFARISGVMLLVVLAVMTVGQLNVDPSCDRYLVPPALLSLAAFMAIVWCRLRTRPWSIAAGAACFVLTFSGAAVMSVRHAGALAFNSACDAPAKICRLKSALAKTGIRRGYATYWNGNVTTLISNGEVTACAVALSPRLRPFRWLTPKWCFDPPSDNRFFLALDRAEIAKFGRDFLIKQAGTPDQIATENEYEVWMYSTANANLDWLGQP